MKNKKREDDMKGSKAKSQECKPSHLRKYFTLVELLVVIAIIAILASMLLPALKNANEQAKAISCTSMMKQRALWAEFYSSDWNVLLPCGQVRNYAFWYNQMLDYSNMKQSTFLAQGVSCPSDSTPNNNYTDPPVFKLSMLYNNYFGMKYSGFNQNEFIKLDAIRNPSGCGMIIDGHIDTSAPRSRGMNWLVTLGMCFDSVEFRHNMRANLLYLDGHTDKLNYWELYTIRTKVGTGN